MHTCLDQDISSSVPNAIHTICQNCSRLFTSHPLVSKQAWKSSTLITKMFMKRLKMLIMKVYIVMQKLSYSQQISTFIHTHIHVCMYKTNIMYNPVRVHTYVQKYCELYYILAEILITNTPFCRHCMMNIQYSVML